MSNEDRTTSRIGAEDLQRLLEQPVETVATDLTQPAPVRRANTIDREDIAVTKERAAVTARGRHRHRRRIFPALVFDLSDEP